MFFYVFFKYLLTYYTPSVIVMISDREPALTGIRVESEINMFTKKPLGFYGVTNTGSVGAIMDIEHGIDDIVVLSNGKKARIRYDQDGNPFFISYKQIWYLDDIMIYN